uniref:Nop domain-containing protein n=1 Tax=Trichuris muris TaxID=70415 RepID=A0A5S6QBB9_TRIMR
MLLLYETAAGYAVFKVSDSFESVETGDIWKHFQSSLEAKKVLDLVYFKKFKDMKQALQAAVAMTEGSLGKPMKKLVKSLIKNDVDSLGVNNAKLASLIREKFQVDCVTNNRVAELMRGVRNQLDSLIEEKVESKELAAMTLGLAHSLCRYKLKFSADQADTMVIQAVGLLDDLDKEINCYVMRCREWYGWHFPELGKLLTDSMTYVKAVRCIGMRKDLDLEQLRSIVSDDTVQKVKELALHSMGSEITDDDSDRIRELCTQILELDTYRDSLGEYMRTRMATLAPNMTALVGEVLAARLIARAGSLVNLAKSASSTVQLLGAEKALFRALKTKRDTPKYGLIYHAQLIGSAPPKLKGKMARMLAAKLSLSCRMDAFAERPVVDTSVALQHRAGLEQKLKYMENVAAFSELPAAKGTPRQCSSWTPKVEQSGYDRTAFLHGRKRAPVEETKPSKHALKKVKREISPTEAISGGYDEVGTSEQNEAAGDVAVPAEIEVVEEGVHVCKKKSKRSRLSSSTETERSPSIFKDVSQLTTSMEESEVLSFDQDASFRSTGEMTRKEKKRKKHRSERKAAQEEADSTERPVVELSETSVKREIITFSGEELEASGTTMPRTSEEGKLEKKKKKRSETIVTERTTMSDTSLLKESLEGRAMEKHSASYEEVSGSVELLQPMAGDGMEKKKKKKKRASVGGLDTQDAQ